MEAPVLENLKVSVKDGKACEKVLSIKVPEEEVKKEFNLFYNAVAPKAKIPGFRPGKAPRSVLEMHYGGEARERVLKNLVSDTLRYAITQEELEPLLYPEIHDVEFDDKSLSYKAMIEVRPRIKISKYKGLSAKKEKVQVKEDAVTEELNRMREGLAQFKTIDERAAQMGDFVVADYVCTCEGKEIDKRKDDWIELKADTFLEELAKALVGTKAGDQKKIPVTFAKNFIRKELAGKTAEFDVSVKEIKEKKLPELSDEMAKDAGDFETLEALKNKIKEDLTAKAESEKEAAFEDELLKQLIKHNKMNLPKGLVAKRKEHLLENTKNGFLQQGATEQMFEEQKEKLSQGLEAEAEKQVHLAFLLEEIAKLENVEVAEGDYKAKYEQVAARVRQPAAEVEKFYAGNQGAKESLHEQIRNEKTIQLIKENAKRK